MSPANSTDDTDRDDFVGRLAALAEAGALTGYWMAIDTMILQWYQERDVEKAIRETKK